MNARSYPFVRSNSGLLPLRSNGSSSSLKPVAAEEEAAPLMPSPPRIRTSSTSRLTLMGRRLSYHSQRSVGAIPLRAVALVVAVVVALLLLSDSIGLTYLLGLGRARFFRLGLKLGVARYTQTVFYDCLDSDTLMYGPRTPPDLTSLEEGERAIPLIATNLDYDTESFLTRLVDGWHDFPVRHKLIAVGGCDTDVLSQVEALRDKYPDIRLYRQREPLGCAPGWNAILEYMMYNADIEWALITNSDIYIPPGSLKALSREIWTHMDSTPKLCRGYFNVIGGQDMVAFVYTRHALNTLGFFDGNIYPAYLEDTEMGVRQERAMRTGLCSDYARFNAATLVHAHNSTKYLSGTTIIRKKLGSGDRRTRIKAKELSMRVQRGHKSSDLYMRIKWRWGQGAKAEYDQPFGNPRFPLSYWKLDEQRRHCIIYAPPSVTSCDFYLQEMIVPNKAMGALTNKRAR